MPEVSLQSGPGLSGILARAGGTDIRSDPPRVPVATIFTPMYDEHYTDPTV